jgi:hypothetical protein
MASLRVFRPTQKIYPRVEHGTFENMGISTGLNGLVYIASHSDTTE